MALDQITSSRPVAWLSLRQFTPARVAVGRTGGSMPTAALLEFRLAHARARDAVLHALDEDKLANALQATAGTEVLRLESAARDFHEYLLRPDLGRTLEPESVQRLESLAGRRFDLAVIVSGGLSALAAETQAAPVLAELIPSLQRDAWLLAPVCLVRRARVAVQDHAGEVLGARIALILLGERPGLISPDSLGAYLVYRPRRGNSDAQRNCVSNICRHGLTAKQAAVKIHWLLSEARRRGISGVELKDTVGETRS